MEAIAINREDTKMIAKVEAMGTWEEERNIANEHNSFDIWTWNGKAYKIYKDSNREMSDKEISVLLSAVKFRRECFIKIPDFLSIQDAYKWLKQVAEEER